MPALCTYEVLVTQKVDTKFHESPDQALIEALDKLGIQDRSRIVTVMVAKNG